MLSLLSSFFKFICSNSYDIKEITMKDRPTYNGSLKKLEGDLSHWYPYGNDYFRIDHGHDYFAFFDKLGQVYMNIILYNNQLVGNCCGILRKLNNQPVWYICDLKIKREHRGQNLPLKMVIHNLHHLQTTSKVYGISMNSAKENRVLRLAQYIPYLSFKKMSDILIYSLQAHEIHKLNEVLEAHFHSFHFVDISRCKKLVLKSGKELRVLHLNPNFYKIKSEYVTIHKEPQTGYLHMFCLYESDRLNKLIKDLGVRPSSSASVIASNMSKKDIKYIMTHEI